MKELYLHIQNRLESILDDNNSPKLRWIDFDQNQFEDEAPPISFPCALVQFSDGYDYETRKDFSQSYALDFTVRFGIKVLERTHSKAAAIFRDETLNHLELVEAWAQTLQGTRGESFSWIERTGFKQETRKGFRVYSITYKVVVMTSVPSHIANAKSTIAKPPIGVRY